MSNTMNEKKIQALAEELTKDPKTPEDLNASSVDLAKITIEAALKVETNEDLGYEESCLDGYHCSNTRNGYSVKKFKGRTVRLTFKRLVIAILLLKRK